MSVGLDSVRIRLEPQLTGSYIALGGGISGTELVLRYAQVLAYLLILAACLFLWVVQDLWPSRQEMAIENLLSGRHVPERLPQMPDYLQFETTGCFGACSVYSVRIDADGKVTFHGRANTCATGVRVRQIAPEMAHRLLAAGRNVNWGAGCRDVCRLGRPPHESRS